MKMKAHVGSDLGSRIAHLEGGGAVWAPISATFMSDRLEVSVMIDVVQGVPICRAYNVTRTDGQGLEAMTTEVARGINLRALMANALASCALEGDGAGFTSASSPEAIEAVIGPLRKPRREATSETLRAFAKAYRERFEPGHMAEFAASVHMSERQAYRLKKLAIERGILKPHQRRQRGKH